MPRSTNNVAARARHKKVLKRARGYYGARSRLYRTAIETAHRSMRYAFVGRRRKKRDFRRLWITRISAAAKMCGMNYSTLINRLKKSGVNLDRKTLADIAVRDMATFTRLAEMAKA
jgi:large subunit ribosomal protein L20